MSAGAGMHCVAGAHAPASRPPRSGCPNAADRPQSPVRGAHEPAGRRAEARQALPPAARPRRDGARGRSAVPPADRRDRPPRPAEAARGGARYRGDGRGHRRPPPAAAAAPPARALSDLYQRRDRRPDPDLFQRAQGLPGEAPAGRRAALRLGHGRALRRHAADGASRPRGRRGRPRQAAAGRAGLSADRGPDPQPAAARRSTARSSACPSCRNGRTRAGWRASGSRLRRGAAQRCTARHEPADVAPEGAAWSRLAYDELLAGQLALALGARASCGGRPAARTPATGTCARS